MQANGEGWSEWKMTSAGLVRDRAAATGIDAPYEYMTADYANRLEAQARRAEGLEKALREIDKATSSHFHKPSRTALHLGGIARAALAEANHET